MSSVALAVTCSVPGLLELLQETALRNEIWRVLIKALPPSARFALHRRTPSKLRDPSSALVLQAWADCEPSGYVASRERVSAAFPLLASYMPGEQSSTKLRQQQQGMLTKQGYPGGSPPPASCMASLAQCWDVVTLLSMASGRREADTRELRLQELFETCGHRQPMFQKWLESDRRGRVHFLHFWQAFGLAERHVASGQSQSSSVQPPLISELEQVRDQVLLDLHDAAAVARCSFEEARLPTVDLFKVACSTAARSVAPDFWRIVSLCLQVSWQDRVDFGIADLTPVMVAWLDDATSIGRLVLLPDLQPTYLPGSLQNRLPVLLNIYDITQDDGVQHFNMLLAHKLSPVKLGGFFHTGVEVNGLEWFYGKPFGKIATGVCCCRPRQNGQHHFRQTVEMEPTALTPDQLADVLLGLMEEYSGLDYNLLRRNCCHWADDFCQRIGSGSIPSWVHRLARFGANVDSAWRVMAFF